MAEMDTVAKLPPSQSAYAEELVLFKMYSRGTINGNAAFSMLLMHTVRKGSVYLICSAMEAMAEMETVAKLQPSQSAYAEELVFF